MDHHDPEPMSPRLLLSLWRERWDKPAAQTLATGFLQGRFDRWIHWLTYWSVWSVPGVTIVAGLCCFMFLSLLLVVQFDLNGQIIFSSLMVCSAIYARRYAGHFVTLLLIGLSAVISARYMYWRLTATLATDIDSDFVFGFCLCLTEMHLWLLAITGTMQDLWPVKKAPIALPGESAGWPEVDVFILCDDETLPSVQSAAMAALGLSWPKRMLKIYILDNRPRDEVQSLADSMAITYLTPTDESNDRTTRINQAVAKTDGDLIAILQCRSIPDADFLKMTVGWFLRDTNLAMVQTPGHFLAPSPSARVMEIFRESDIGITCALIRRSLFIEVNGIERGPVSKRTHTALKLQAAGYSTGYLGFGASAEKSNAFQESGVKLVKATAIDVFLAYRPFGDYSLLWKLQLGSFQAALRFFRPIPRLAYFCAPAAYLLLDIHLVRTSAALLGAYALPHLIHGYIAKERRLGEQRFSIVTDIREMLLAWYVLCMTTWSLLWTEITQSRSLFRPTARAKPSAFEWATVWPYLIIVALNLAALTSGITHLVRSPTQVNEMSVLFVVWALYNLMLLAAALAVAEESRHIRLHTSLQKHLPAMIRMPTGRTLSCITENFPEVALNLKLPMPVAIEKDMTVNISVFHNNHEFSFPARVALETDLVLRAQIDGPAQNVYRSLAVAAYSRGQDWPKWLPAHDVDHPLPKWLQQAFAVLRQLTLNFVSRRLRGRWIKIGKKR